MMKRLAAALVLLLVGTAPIGLDPSAATRVLARPYAAFGFDLLRDLHADAPQMNVVVSPTSIATALAMLSNGAQGSTRAGILKAIHAGAMTTDALDNANRALVAQIAGTNAVQLTAANALWLQHDFPANPAFTQTLRSSYSAQVENLDFQTAGAAAARTINDWASQHTNGRVQKILDTVDPLTIAILTNAVAFKGSWSLKFDPKLTVRQDFTSASGSVGKVPMMRNTAQFAYRDANGVEAIRLPYADGTFAMYVVLPRDNSAMHAFLTG